MPEVGTYTVSLTATNALGENTETKTDYIMAQATLTTAVSGSGSVDPTGGVYNPDVDVGITADAVGAQLVRPTQQRLSGVGELDLLQLRSDDLDSAVKCQLNCILFAHKIRHGIEYGFCIAVRLPGVGRAKSKIHCQD